MAGPSNNPGSNPPAGGPTPSGPRIKRATKAATAHGASGPNFGTRAKNAANTARNAAGSGLDKFGQALDAINLDAPGKIKRKVVASIQGNTLSRILKVVAGVVAATGIYYGAKGIGAGYDATKNALHNRSVATDNEKAELEQPKPEIIFSAEFSINNEGEVTMTLPKAFPKIDKTDNKGYELSVEKITGQDWGNSKTVEPVIVVRKPDGSTVRYKVERVDLDYRSVKGGKKFTTMVKAHPQGEIKSGTQTEPAADTETN